VKNYRIFAFLAWLFIRGEIIFKEPMRASPFLANFAVKKFEAMVFKEKSRLR